jgi:heparan-alpha-glucosaminide N-acetyltransferase
MNPAIAPNRIVSIDIMRGLTLFLMLFVNDLYMPGVPQWLGHTEAQEDGMGLADWVFPGFLFMVGMAIPFAYKIRKKHGDGDARYLKHMLLRSLSLIFIGVIMVNIGRLNPDMTGMPKYIWALCVYACIFLIWNDYKLVNEKLRIYSKTYKFIGLIGLVILIYIFKAGTPDDPSWFIQSWWGILGLIGWSYLVASLVYFWIKDNIFISLLIWMAFVLLNGAALSGYTTFLDDLKPVFGVILNGNTPSIVLAGLFSGILLDKYRSQTLLLTKMYLTIGTICITAGFVLRNWYIVSKIIATPSWAMICNGISFIVLGILFYLIDYKGFTKWFSVFKPAGENSLTTYLAPDMIYYIIWSLSVPVLIYKKSNIPLLVIAGSLLWAFLMIRLAKWLESRGIKLKL